MKAKRLLPILLGAGALAMAGCKKSPDPEEEKPPPGPQSGHGAILDAAKKAADTANEQVDQLEEGAAGAGQ